MSWGYFGHFEHQTCFQKLSPHGAAEHWPHKTCGKKQAKAKTPEKSRQKTDRCASSDLRSFWKTLDNLCALLIHTVIDFPLSYLPTSKFIGLLISVQLCLLMIFEDSWWQIKAISQMSKPFGQADIWGKWLGISSQMRKFVSPQTEWVMETAYSTGFSTNRNSRKGIIGVWERQKSTYSTLGDKGLKDGSCQGLRLKHVEIAAKIPTQKLQSWRALRQYTNVEAPGTSLGRIQTQ